MAVVPMQKVRFVVHADDADVLLGMIQRVGAVEFTAVDADETTSTALVAPHHLLLPRVQHAASFLAPFAPKQGLWKTLREGTFTELSESEIVKRMQDSSILLEIVSDVERVQVELAEIEDIVLKQEAELALLKEWQHLPFTLSQLQTKTTKTVLVRTRLGVDETASLQQRLQIGLDQLSVAFEITEVDSTHVALTLSQASFSQADLEKLLEGMGAELSAVPAGTQTIDIELTRAEEALAKARGDRGLVYDQAEHFAITHLKNLQIAGEVLTWEQDRYAVLDSGRATQSTVVLDGWLNAEKRADIESLIAEQNIAAVLQERELEEGEEPPVDIKNSAFVQPFEVVTRLYGMPGHKDLDPTLFLAGFFFLFFGLSLTDVGYGLTLMIVSIVVLTMFKVAPVVRTFAKLLLFMGLGSFLVGLLFGGYLGIPAEALPAPLQAIAIFDPIGNPLPVFYLALGLGVFQVMVGMFLKIYSDARNGEFVKGVLDQGPWLFVFFVAIAYLAVTTGYLSGVTESQLINLIYVGLVMVVLASGRNGKTLMEKVQKAALSLYDSIGYFSDILSYSRLLALGLATTALAFAVNLIAEIVSGSVPYLGPVLAIVVLVIGHLFTLAVNTLGAFIHSARLQFVEFFGKFIAGTGREFKPLRRSERYIAVKDE